MAEVLIATTAGSFVKGLGVLNSTLSLERFGKAFDARQGGRANGFIRHVSSPGSWRKVTRLPLLEPEHGMCGKNNY